MSEGIIINTDELYDEIPEVKAKEAITFRAKDYNFNDAKYPTGIEAYKECLNKILSKVVVDSSSNEIEKFSTSIKQIAEDNNLNTDDSEILIYNIINTINEVLCENILGYNPYFIL